MAIYRFSAQVIKRSEGRSAVAAASYRSGETLRDDRAGATHRGRKTDVSYAAILAPASAPVWATDRERLWNQVEACERRRDAQLAREFQLALPHELTPEQNRELVESWAQRELVGRGMVADIAIHDPAKARRRHGADGSDVRNVHAHIMTTMREIGPEGFGTKQRAWNDKKLLEHWRSSWAEHVNRALERHGIDARVDHRSLAEQGSELLPQPKLGPAAAAMERRGIASRRGDFLREVHARNQERIALDRLEVRELIEQARADHAYAQHLRQVEQQRLTAAAVPRPEPARPRPVARPSQGAPEARPPAPPASVGHAAWRIEGVQSELQQIEQRRRKAIEMLQNGSAKPEKLLETHPRVQEARKALEGAQKRLEAVRPSLLDRVRHRLGGPDPRAAERQALEQARQALRDVRRELLPEARAEAARIRREASPVPSRRELQLRRELQELERAKRELEQRERQARLERKKPAARVKMGGGARARGAAPRMTMGPRMGGRR